MATVTADTPTHVVPRSLIASVPWLWSNVVFPGRIAVESGIRWRSLALMTILPALLLYPTLSFHLLEPDEGRYAEIPREMLLRGDWVVPHLQGQPYLDKPPLLYWLVMLSYSIFGVHDWAARIVPAVAVHLSIYTVYLVGRRSLGERAAFWGALALSVSPLFVSMGRLLILDGLLAACTTVALFAAFEAMRGSQLRWSWWLIAATATGLGILTKGPVALILVAAPIWIYRRLNGSSCRIGVGPVSAFVVTMLLVNLPWYVAIGLRAPVFLRYFFWEHNIVRFVAPFDHIRPVWFYLPILLVGLLPVGAAAPIMIRHLLSGSRRQARQRAPELGFFLIAGLWCVAFFSMSGSKLPTYILPAFPPLMLAIGAFIANGKWTRRLAAVTAVGGVAFLAWFHLDAIPWYAKMRSPMGEPERVRRYCADSNQRVLCFPRSCDSVSFYLGRDDLRNVRSKDALEFIRALQERPRTVVLFTHRHSLEALRYSLPADLAITEVVTFKREKSVGRWYDVLTTETPWGLCDLAVVEKK